jgi:ABC-2 type transport system ATP-binding protein
VYIKIKSIEPMSISVTNLSKHYGTQKAVNNISFTVNKGEIVGFLGPNGAGKSTTMKMLTGYLNADEGQIEICNIPVLENNIDTKKRIGYLPEANPLYLEMYVREYLAFIAGVHKISGAGYRIEEVIGMVGLTPEAHKKIGQLSKGYKQRVGLAAALVHSPEVLILDEPTSGLDPNQIVEIRNVIKSLATEKTILFSSHIMQEVEAICDRVIIINKGNIVADDRLTNLQKINGSLQQVMVAFKETVDINLILNLAAVKNVLPTTSHSNYTIQGADAETIKKQLLQLSIEKNLNIVSLQSDEKSLENVFRTLTN